MADKTGGLAEGLRQNPAAGRLMEEVRDYLRARAERAVTDLGGKLGDQVSRLSGSSDGGGSGMLSGLAKGGQALAEGKSPTGAALKMGASTVKDKVKDKVKGAFGGGGDKAKGGGSGSKSMTIIEDIDIGLPVRTVYDQWTQFQEFSTFAKGVVSVETSDDDDTTSSWKVKVAKSQRSWTANVTEQVPDERIHWKTEGSKGTVKGVVSFHPLGEDLTRVLLVLEYFPSGFFEKTANIWRAPGRRARLDLKLFRKFVMMRGEATDSWRGEIQDGEVVVDHETAVENEEREATEDSDDDASADHPAEDEPHDEGEEDEAEDENEPEDEEEEEYEDDEEDEEDEDEEPPRREPAGSRTRSRG